MTKIEIIDETVKYYETHPRAVRSSNVCQYKTIDGLICAHSRCLTPEALEQIVQINWNASASDTISKFGGDSIHQEKYRGHSGTFWNAIQRFHDTSIHWEDNRLTNSGKDYVNILKDRYK